MNYLIRISVASLVLSTLMFLHFQAFALSVSDLRGSWRNDSVDIIRIHQDPHDRWQGTLVKVSPGSDQIGYKRDQLVIRNFKISGNVINFEYSSTDYNPLIAAKCQQHFVNFQGSYLVDGGKQAIIGEHEELEFELPWDIGEPCIAKRTGGLVLNNLRKIPERNFVLRNLQIHGFFHCQHPDFSPPYAPFSDVTVDGHFRVFLPKGFFPKKGDNEHERNEGLVTATLYRKDPSSTAWVADNSSPARLPRCVQPYFQSGLGSSSPGDVEGLGDTPRSIFGIELRPTPSDFVAADFMPGRVSLPLNMDPNSGHFPVHLDEVINYRDYAGRLWELLLEGDRNQKFRVRLKANAIGDQSALDVYTPVFSKDEISRVLEHRLNHLSQRLLHMSLDDFHKKYFRFEDGKNATKYDSAKPVLWLGYYKAISELNASVDVENLLNHNSRHDITLRLVAKFRGDSEIKIAEKKVVLGAKKQNEKVSNVQLRSRDTMKFDTVIMGRGKELYGRKIEKLTSIYVKVDPPWAGDAGKATIDQTFDKKQLRSIERFITFSTRLEQMAKSRNGKPWDPATVRKAGTRHPTESKTRGDELADIVASAKFFMEDQYKEFVRLHKIYIAFLLIRGNSELDKLDRHVRRYWGQGQSRALGFGSPFEHRPMTAPGAKKHGWEDKEFVLEQSNTNVALAFVSATLNPQLSFAMDPTLFPLLGDRAPEESGTASAKLQGVTNWVFQSGNKTADYDEGMNRLRSSDAMKQAYKRITGGRGSQERWSTEFRRKIKTGDLDAVRGRLFEETMIMPMLKAEADRLGKLKASGSNQPIFVDTLVLDGSQISGGSNPAKNISAGELTDGLVLGKTRDGRWHILRVAEAKSGAPGAQDIFGQFRKDLRRMLNADIKLKNLTLKQQGKLGINSQTHTFNHVGSDTGLRANFTNSDIYIPFVTADADITLPPPRSSDGPGVAAIRRAMETRVARSALNTNDTHLIARIFFKQAGVKPEAWYKVHVNFDDFMRITRRSAKARGMEVPKKAVMEELFAKGHRLNPETGEWQRVIPEWIQPVLSIDRIVAMAVEHYKNRNNQKEPPAEKVAKWRANARAGKRFNPNSRYGSWPGLGSPKFSKQDTKTLLTRGGALQKDYKAPILDPLSATLTEDEKRIWIKYSGQVPTDPGERARFIERFMTDHMAFDLETRRFRELSDREKLLRNILRRNPDYGAAYNHRIRNMDLAGDIVERLAAATAETARIARERLKVVVHHSDNAIKVEVIPVVVYQNGKTKLLTIPSSYQKALLRRYYKYSENMFVERKLPEWLEYQQR